MAENVFEIISNENPTLAKKLTENEDVSQFLMATYSHLLHMAIESSRNPADLRCSVSIGKERLLVIHTSYVDSSGSRVDIGDKLPRQRNLNLVKFLKVNNSVRSLALNAVYALEAWLNEKPYRKKQGFENIKLENGMHWKSGEFTVELVMKFEFDEMVAAKMNWELDDPEQPTEGSIIQ